VRAPAVAHYQPDEELRDLLARGFPADRETFAPCGRCGEASRYAAIRGWCVSCTILDMDVEVAEHYVSIYKDGDITAGLSVRVREPPLVTAWPGGPPSDETMHEWSIFTRRRYRVQDRVQLQVCGQPPRGAGLRAPEL